MVRPGWGRHPSLLDGTTADSHHGEGPHPKDARRGLHHKQSQEMEQVSHPKISNFGM
jgi:hypothetical protein